MQGNTTQDTHHDASGQACGCPLCALMGMVGHARRQHGTFFHHLGNAEIELLKAFKSLIDQRITTLESEADPEAHSKRATRIEVE